MCRALFLSGLNHLGRYRMHLPVRQNTVFGKDVMRRLRGRSEDTSMKAFTILPVAAAALFALTTAAYSQANCQNDYTACMTSCASKSMKSMQDTCFGTCENNNNICSEKMFGKRPFNGAPSSVAEQKGVAKNALAKKTKQQDAQPEQVAEEAPQQTQAPQQGQAPQQTQAAPQRAPAKR
jgi:hypothetical protein